MKAPLALIISLMFASSLFSAGRAFPPTPAGTIEIKELPAGRLLEAKGDRSYFARSNNLFGPLFRYISQHEISMTTPVLADIDPGAMYFWVDDREAEKAQQNTSRVRVIDVPKKRVASAGFRGGYNRSNYEASKTQLMDWLNEQPQLESVGEPYAVFWSSPMVPSYFKSYEIHMLVRSKEATKQNPQ